MNERCKDQTCQNCWVEEFRKVNSPKYDDLSTEQCLDFCGAPQALEYAAPEKIHGTEFCVLNRRNVE